MPTLSTPGRVSILTRRNGSGLALNLRLGDAAQSEFTGLHIIHEVPVRLRNALDFFALDPQQHLCIAFAHIDAGTAKVLEGLSQGRPVIVDLLVCKTATLHDGKHGPGIKLSDVDHAARGLIQASGFPVYGHGTGHGIGLEIHEAPTLNPHASDALTCGQIVTIEPGIYLPGKLGIRLEEDVMITAKGTQVLTRACRHFQRLEEYRS